MSNTFYIRLALILMILIFSTGCQTVTIINDQVDSTTPTEIHKVRQFSSLFALVPITKTAYNTASQCNNTWGKLEFNHAAKDIFTTWGLDSLLLFSFVDPFSVALLSTVEITYMQGVFGSGLILDSQTIKLSCTQ